jgi:hypothetical protein
MMPTIPYDILQKLKLMVVACPLAKLRQVDAPLNVRAVTPEPQLIWQ